jgi:NAD(P)H-flavin reductase
MTPSPETVIDDPELPVPFRVRRRVRETADTVTLQLEPPGGQFPFQPGQFNMIAALGAGEVPISISGSAGVPQVLQHTIRAVGAATRRLLELRAGDWATVRGPFGRGWPLEQEAMRDLVVVTGGLGLAPLRSAILHVLAHRERYGRVLVLCGARTPRDVLYSRELERWRGRFDIEVRLTVDRAGADWRGNIGVVTTLFHDVDQLVDTPSAIALMCGPEVMMRFAVRDLQKRGLKDENIHLSLERNMQCGVGHCGHCQYGPYFLCKDGPVFAYSQIRFLFDVREM